MLVNKRCQRVKLNRELLIDPVKQVVDASPSTTVGLAPAANVLVGDEDDEAGGVVINGGDQVAAVAELGCRADGCRGGSGGGCTWRSG